MKTTCINFCRIGLCMLLCVMGTALAQADDVLVEVKSIVAGDSYPDATVSAKHLISRDGLEPNPPTNVATARYGMVGWDCWHTTGTDNSKAWLLMDLGEAVPVAEMYIWNLNEYDYRDRDIREIALSASADSEDGKDGSWVELGRYEIPQSPGGGVPCTPQACIYVGRNVRYIRIQALSSYGSQYWGLGKIILTRENGAVSEDLKELKRLYTQYSGYRPYEYMTATWGRLSAACETAANLIDGTTVDEDEVQAALEELKASAAALQRKENLAPGATATATSCYGAGYEASKAVDGDLNTRWASEAVSGSLSFTVDLKEPQDFNQVMMFENEEYGERIGRIAISVSDDGKIWNEWGSHRLKEACTSVAAGSVRARYVRIEFFDCVSEGINIDEVMVFNDPQATSSEQAAAWRDSGEGWIVQQPSTEPNVYQIRKAHLKYGMFIHYGLNTFVGEEWTDGSYPASTYHPDLSTLDPESWVKAAYEGGMNFVVLVAKHHDGFALWNTQVGTYDINHTGRAGDARDIVKEVADACRKYGIKLGLYYSIWDRHWDRHHTQESEGMDRVQLCQAYNDYALAQVTELLDGRYGEIIELWLDGPWGKNNSAWEFARLYDTVKRLQPTCQMAVNSTIYGVNPDQYEGGEELTYFPSDFRLQDPLFTRPGANADPKVYRFGGNEYYLPFEATICINKTWFWSTQNAAANVLPASKIKSSYEHMVEQGNTLVMNLAPGKNGLFSSYDVEGLYAGARALGIARGDARSVQEGDCAVRVDYVTTEGYVAWPTRYIYGKAGEAFEAQFEDLAADGYRFAGERPTVNGVFGQDTQVTFVYEDKGEGATSVPGIQVSQWGTVEGGIWTVCPERPCTLEMYAPDGMKRMARRLAAGESRIEVGGLHGMFLVSLRTADGCAKVWKMLLK